MLDNEPDLWSSTHRRLRGSVDASEGAKLTYAELFQRTEDYASAIKDVAPNALVFGPASYGWQGLRRPAGRARCRRTRLHQRLPRRDEGLRDGARPPVSSMSSTCTGIRKRPAAASASSRITTPTPWSPPASRRRARSMTAPYIETSWITQFSTGGPINLIPREMAKINAGYPGTGLSFSEYNYGGANHYLGRRGRSRRAWHLRPRRRLRRQRMAAAIERAVHPGRLRHVPQFRRRRRGFRRYLDPGHDQRRFGHGHLCLDRRRPSRTRPLS